MGWDGKEIFIVRETHRNGPASKLSMIFLRIILHRFQRWSLHNLTLNGQGWKKLLYFFRSPAIKGNNGEPTPSSINLQRSDLTFTIIMGRQTVRKRYNVVALAWLLDSRETIRDLVERSAFLPWTSGNRFQVEYACQNSTLLCFDSADGIHKKYSSRMSDWNSTSSVCLRSYSDPKWIKWDTAINNHGFGSPHSRWWKETQPKPKWTC